MKKELGIIAGVILVVAFAFFAFTFSIAALFILAMDEQVTIELAGLIMLCSLVGSILVIGANLLGKLYQDWRYGSYKKS